MMRTFFNFVEEKDAAFLEEYNPKEADAENREIKAKEAEAKATGQEAKAAKAKVKAKSHKPKK